MVIIMKGIVVFAAIEGLLIGASGFLFMLDHNGGPEGLRSRKLYEQEASYYHRSIGEEQMTSDNEEILSLSLLYDDFVGYLEVSGTSIDYPVMQDRTDSEGNYFYLTHDYTGDEDPGGCPFVRRSSSTDDDIIEVYAHNMSNGTMFSDLEKFENEDFFYEHGDIVFDMISGRRTYKVVSVLDVAVSGGPFTFFGWSNFPDEETEMEFIRQITECSVQQRSSGLIPGEQYLLLVTCEYSHENGRRVVVAVRTS